MGRKCSLTLSLSFSLILSLSMHYLVITLLACSNAAVLSVLWQKLKRYQNLRRTVFCAILLAFYTKFREFTEFVDKNGRNSNKTLRKGVHDFDPAMDKVDELVEMFMLEIDAIETRQMTDLFESELFQTFWSCDSEKCDSKKKEVIGKMFWYEWNVPRFDKQKEMGQEIVESRVQRFPDAYILMPNDSTTNSTSDLSHCPVRQASYFLNA